MGLPSISARASNPLTELSQSFLKNFLACSRGSWNVGHANHLLERNLKCCRLLGHTQIPFRNE